MLAAEGLEGLALAHDCLLAVAVPGPEAAAELGSLAELPLPTVLVHVAAREAIAQLPLMGWGAATEEHPWWNGADRVRGAVTVVITAAVELGLAGPRRLEHPTDGTAGAHGGPLAHPILGAVLFAPA